MTETVERRCRIEQIFTRPFIELIVLAPRNPLVRGLILAQTGKMPAVNCNSFERVQEWVETHCEQKTPAKRREVGVVIPVDFSETESGRATYSVQRTGSDEFKVGAEKLLEWAQVTVENGGSLDEVIDRITDEIHEFAWSECSPDMDDTGDYNYDPQDSDGTDDAKIEFSQTVIRERLIAFLKDQEPELLEELL